MLWTTAEGTSVPGRRLRKPETATTRLKPDPAGRWAVDADGSIRQGKASLWDLQGLAGARPIELRRSGTLVLLALRLPPERARGLLPRRTTSTRFRSGRLEARFRLWSMAMEHSIGGPWRSHPMAVTWSPTGGRIGCGCGRFPGPKIREVVDVKLPETYRRHGTGRRPDRGECSLDGLREGYLLGFVDRCRAPPARGIAET